MITTKLPHRLGSYMQQLHRQLPKGLSPKQQQRGLRVLYSLAQRQLSQIGDRRLRAQDYLGIQRIYQLGAIHAWHREHGIDRPPALEPYHLRGLEHGIRLLIDFPEDDAAAGDTATPLLKSSLLHSLEESDPAEWMALREKTIADLAREYSVNNAYLKNNAPQHALFLLRRVDALLKNIFLSFKYLGSGEAPQSPESALRIMDAPQVQRRYIVHGHKDTLTALEKIESRKITLDDPKQQGTLRNVLEDLEKIRDIFTLSAIDRGIQTSVGKNFWVSFSPVMGRDIRQLAAGLKVLGDKLDSDDPQQLETYNRRITDELNIILRVLDEAGFGRGPFGRKRQQRLRSISTTGLRAAHLLDKSREISGSTLPALDIQGISIPAGTYNESDLTIIRLERRLATLFGRIAPPRGLSQLSLRKGLWLFEPEAPHELASLKVNRNEIDGAVQIRGQLRTEARREGEAESTHEFSIRIPLPPGKEHDTGKFETDWRVKASFTSFDDGRTALPWLRIWQRLFLFLKNLGVTYIDATGMTSGRAAYNGLSLGFDPSAKRFPALCKDFQIWLLDNRDHYGLTADEAHEISQAFAGSERGWQLATFRHGDHELGKDFFFNNALDIHSLLSGETINLDLRDDHGSLRRLYHNLYPEALWSGFSEEDAQALWSKALGKNLAPILLQEETIHARFLMSEYASKRSHPLWWGIDPDVSEYLWSFCETFFDMQDLLINEDLHARMLADRFNNLSGPIIIVLQFLQWQVDQQRGSAAIEGRQATEDDEFRLLKLPPEELKRYFDSESIEEILHSRQELRESARLLSGVLTIIERDQRLRGEKGLANVFWSFIGHVGRAELDNLLKVIAISTGKKVDLEPPPALDKSVLE